MRFVTIVGARPQFIKAAVVSHAAQNTPGLRETLVHTGQHYDDNMSRVFFEELEIPEPAYHLGIGSGQHGAQTGRMLESIEQVLLKEKPDLVLVYGDTNSTLAGALAACKLHIPVAHVEAGLRSYNRKMPEEVNRVLTDHASSLLFAPTQAAVVNLDGEGIRGKHVALTGDVMYDAALYYGRRSEGTSKILETVGVKPGNYILATVHRAENTDDANHLRTIFQALVQISESTPVVIPLHPRTRLTLAAQKMDTQNLKLLPPVGYLDMVALTRNARLVCTDSGGLQKEAYFHSVPCFTLREETEWVELVEMGCNTLYQSNTTQSLATQIMTTALHGFPRSAQCERPYGDGHASEQICRVLASL